MIIIYCIVWWLIGVVTFSIYMFNLYDELTIGDCIGICFIGFLGLFLVIGLVYKIVTEKINLNTVVLSKKRKTKKI